MLIFAKSASENLNILADKVDQEDFDDISILTILKHFIIIFIGNEAFLMKNKLKLNNFLVKFPFFFESQAKMRKQLHFSEMEGKKWKKYICIFLLFFTILKHFFIIIMGNEAFLRKSKSKLNIFFLKFPFFSESQAKMRKQLHFS